MPINRDRTFTPREAVEAYEQVERINGFATLPKNSVDRVTMLNLISRERALTPNETAEVQTLGNYFLGALVELTAGTTAKMNQAVVDFLKK